MYRMTPMAAPDPIPVNRPSRVHGASCTLKISWGEIVWIASPRVGRLLGSESSGNGFEVDEGDGLVEDMSGACRFTCVVHAMTGFSCELFLLHLHRP